MRKRLKKRMNQTLDGWVCHPNRHRTWLWRFSQGVHLRWAIMAGLCHWSEDRITGAITPYVSTGADEVFRAAMRQQDIDSYVERREEPQPVWERVRYRAAAPLDLDHPLPRSTL